ncbi:ral GTPase-activating protein subunit alpha-1-like [Amphiura filiformis]|uniref:ral GTPase-activating protein subunit alpha-1-like n=1 Tax=Amphiura filiformis TaxID=82378 RepID=UPI003B218E6C
MFSKKPHGDVKKSSQKVLDPRKDALTRLKHLRVVLENTEPPETKNFFEQFYSHIYNVFYDNFIIVEANLRQKVQKRDREELDIILCILEKIFLYLPDLIHSGWQFHSIGQIMKKLVHVGNTYKLRLEGMRLFLLWYQALQEHAVDECHLMYATLVQGFPVPVGIKGSSLEYTMSADTRPANNSDCPVTEIEIAPVIPSQPGDKTPENIAKSMLEKLLELTVSQGIRMEWQNSKRTRDGFIFLLDKFRKYYMPHIFPEFSYDTSLYKPVLDIPESRSNNSPRHWSTVEKNPMLACRVTVVQWVVSFITVKNLNSKISTLRMADILECQPNGWSEDRQENNRDSLERNIDAPLIQDGETPTVSPSSTLSYKDQIMPGIVPGVISGEELELMEAARNMVQNVLYSTRENVNFVHEILRQGFLLPMSESAAMKKALKVYNDWIQLTESKPVFMEEPSVCIAAHLINQQKPTENGSITTATLDSSTTSSEVTEPDSPTAEEPETADDKAHLLQARTNSVEQMAPFQVQAQHMGKPRRSNSYIDTPTDFPGAINQAIKDDLGKCNVGAGLQATVQVFITHSANVFLLEPATHPSSMVRDHVDICKRVLKLFKHIVMNVKMEKRTWEQLLMVLLRVTEGVLGGNPSRPRMSLGQQLAQNLFQTLIVTWIKANLEILVSSDLWDNFLRVLSSLTHWEELIREWSRTMETLTRVLAKRVYNLDLNNLPLDKLSGTRSRRVIRTANNKHSPNKMERRTHERTFSRGWERSDSGSPRGADDTDGRDRGHGNYNRGPTVGSRDDLDRLKQRVPYMREVSSREEAAEMIAKMKNCESKPLPLSMSQPALVRSRSAFEEDVIPENDVVRNRTEFQRSSSLGDLCEREPLQRLKGGSSKVSSSAENLLGNDKDEQEGDEEDEEEGTRDADETKSRELRLADIMGQDSISIDSSEVTTPDVNRLPPTQDSSRLTPTSLTDLLNQDHLHSHEHTQSNPPSPGVFDPGTMANIKSPSEENIRIEDRIETTLNESMGNISNEDASVISGGTRTGWLPEVAVVVWRRILGALGDVNEIQKSRLHAAVMECLWTIWQMLAKIRDNLGITLDNQTTPPPPEYIPPLRMLSPWLFRATDMSNAYQSGRLSAYKLLCSMTVRKQDHPLPKEHLIHFYRVLHFGLVGTDQEIINTIIQYSAPEFFACDLPGSTMLILDFIHAANMIASSPNKHEAPRIEALSLLGSLVCFPNMFCNMSVLQPSANDLSLMTCKDVKDHLASVLLKWGKKEPNCEARCIALCSLGIFLYEELVHVTYHQRMKEAITVLLASLKCENKCVAQVACDMLLLLCDHAERLRRALPEVPKKIIEVIANTISNLLHSVETSDHEENKKLVVSLLFCLLEWCMALPLCALLETVENKHNQMDRILLEIVFQVLQTAAEGIPVGLSSEMGTQDDVNLDGVKDSQTTTDGIRTKNPIQGDVNDPSIFDEDLDELDDVVFFVPTEHFGNAPSTPTTNPSSSIIRLAAKTVMCHLINHLNHFPLGGGPACVTSLVNEFDDQSSFDLDEMSPAVFESSNMQFFIFNDNAIVSIVQIPSKPGDDLSGGLTTANSHVRTVVRSISGKFAWDASLLYGPAEYRVDTTGGVIDRYESSSSEESSPTHSKGSSLDIRIVSRLRKTMPSYKDDGDGDVLDELAQYIGYTSPEVLLRPGIKLNLPSPAPEEITEQIEKSVITSLLRQHSMEDDYSIRIEVKEALYRKSYIRYLMRSQNPASICVDSYSVS